MSKYPREYKTKLLVKHLNKPDTKPDVVFRLVITGSDYNDTWTVKYILNLVEFQRNQPKPGIDKSLSVAMKTAFDNLMAFIKKQNTVEKMDGTQVKNK